MAGPVSPCSVNQIKRVKRVCQKKKKRYQKYHYRFSREKKRYTEVMQIDSGRDGLLQHALQPRNHHGHVRDQRIFKPVPLNQSFNMAKHQMITELHHKMIHHYTGSPFLLVRRCLLRVCNHRFT